MDKCFECGSSNDLYDHHVVPRSKGGTKTLKLCMVCHDKAHNRKSKGSIRELTKEALQKKKTNGEKYGEVPYGYNCINGQLIENNEETELIRQVKKMRYEGYTLQCICDHLERQGINTKKNKKKWYPASIKRLLVSNIL